MRVFDSLGAFTAAEGEELGTSDWFTVTQEQINAYADASGDHQWIHIDPERAACGPFGATIAHGFLTLSIVPVLGQSIYSIEGLTMAVNYGVDGLRFPQAVPVDSRIRETATLKSVTEVPLGIRATVSFVIELEGSTKPACVLDALYIFAA